MDTPLRVGTASAAVVRIVLRGRCAEGCSPDDSRAFVPVRAIWLVVHELVSFGRRRIPFETTHRVVSMRLTPHRGLPLCATLSTETHRRLASSCATGRMARAGADARESSGLGEAELTTLIRDAERAVRRPARGAGAEVRAARVHLRRSVAARVRLVRAVFGKASRARSTIEEIDRCAIGASKIAALAEHAKESVRAAAATEDGAALEAVSRALLDAWLRVVPGQNGRNSGLRRFKTEDRVQHACQRYLEAEPPILSLNVARALFNKVGGSRPRTPVFDDAAVSSAEGRCDEADEIAAERELRAAAECSTAKSAAMATGVQSHYAALVYFGAKRADVANAARISESAVGNAVAKVTAGSMRAENPLVMRANFERLLVAERPISPDVDELARRALVEAATQAAQASLREHLDTYGDAGIERALVLGFCQVGTGPEVVELAQSALDKAPRRVHGCADGRLEPLFLATVFAGRPLGELTTEVLTAVRRRVLRALLVSLPPPDCKEYASRLAVLAGMFEDSTQTSAVIVKVGLGVEAAVAQRRSSPRVAGEHRVPRRAVAPEPSSASAPTQHTLGE
jgi:DNA-binding transcriptional ArsR family regulator